MFGGAGKDELKGEGGPDILVGNARKDVLNGGASNDCLKAKDGGRDNVIGGPGGNDRAIVDASDNVSPSTENVGSC
jgi:hypothetical protein